jgi:hypothetical protein
MKLVASGAGCAAAPSELVDGISCTEPSICHPKPAAADANSASWKITVASSDKDAVFDVCYCAGVCFAATHWTKVPGAIKVAKTEKMWETVDYEGSVSRHDSFTLVASTDEAVKIVAASDDCAAASVLTLTALGDNKYTVPVPIYSNVDFGKYTVCIGGEAAYGKGAGWTSRYLELTAKFPQDATRTSGLYVDQTFSAKVPSAPTLEVQGTLIQTHTQARIALTRSASCKDAETDAFEDWDPFVWTKDLVALEQDDSDCKPAGTTCWDCTKPRKAAGSDVFTDCAATPDVAECKDCCDTDPCATTRKWKTTLKLPTAKAGAYGICYCDGREDPLCEQIRGGAAVDICAAVQSGGWACEDTWAAKCLGDHPAGAASNSITIRQRGGCSECPAGSGLTASPALEAMWTAQNLEKPTKKYLEKFSVTKAEIVRMTAADLQKKNYSGEVVEGLPDEPVIADILKGQKFSVTDVLWTLALHFNLTKTRFVDVAALLSGTEQPVVKAKMALGMSQKSFDALKADPAKSKAGLASGISTELGVAQEDVEIVTTTPSLYGRRLEAEEARRLAEVMLTVEFKVAGADLAAIEAAVEATMDNVGSLMASVTEALADQGITVKITSASMEKVDELTPTPAPTPAPTEEEYGYGEEDEYGYEDYGYETGRRLASLQDSLLDILSAPTRELAMDFLDGLPDNATNDTLKGEYFADAAKKLIKAYGISARDVIWTAALATAYEPTDLEIELWDLNDTTTFKVTVDGIFLNESLAETHLRRLAEGCPYLAGASDDVRRLARCYIDPDEAPPPKPDTTGFTLVAANGTVFWPEDFDPTIERKFDRWDALFQHVKKLAVMWPGGLCGTPEQFTEQAGTLYVTERANIGQTFVVEPGSEGSIEVTGSGLKPWADRILLVNCQDTCGVSGPSKQVGFPDGEEIGAFTYFEPYRDLTEGDENCPYVNYTQNPYLVHDTFELEKSRYCNGVQLDTESLRARGGDLPPVAELLDRHRCANKCSKECNGEHCFCSGDIGESDSFVSGAVCLPQYECEHLCMLLGDACHSVNMHKTLPRCFINTNMCEGQANEYLGLDDDYDLLRKLPEAAERSLSSSITEPEDIDWKASSRGDLVSADGYSTPSVLRFGGLGLPSAGQYKVCFCDSDVAGGECSAATDFTVEIGKLHVSGLGCLLSVPKLRTATCVEQYFGGLRCNTD